MKALVYLHTEQAPAVLKGQDLVAINQDGMIIIFETDGDYQVACFPYAQVKSVAFNRKKAAEKPAAQFVTGESMEPAWVGTIREHLSYQSDGLKAINNKLADLLERDSIAGIQKAVAVAMENAPLQKLIDSLDERDNLIYESAQGLAQNIQPEALTAALKVAIKQIEDDGTNQYAQGKKDGFHQLLDVISMQCPVKTGVLGLPNGSTLDLMTGDIINAPKPDDDEAVPVEPAPNDNTPEVEPRPNRR